VEREAICPYRGLDPFREEDSAFFFGRGSADDPNSQIGELVVKIREQRFVMVVGRSGSGKSSLVSAAGAAATTRSVLGRLDLAARPHSTAGIGSGLQSTRRR
jgi:energy-coupling factor transporter ATP-binding protein EcfA2